MSDVVRDSLGVSRSWGDGPEVVFLSNPLADPVLWSSTGRESLLRHGYRVTTFEHGCAGLDWRSAVSCVAEFVAHRARPVALVGWSQGAVLAQETALAVPEYATCAVLLATYGRQNEIDKTLQASWDLLAAADEEWDSLRLAMSFLTSFPAEQLADDDFVAHMRAIQTEWSARPDQGKRQRSSCFIATYQDRLEALMDLSIRCLVMGFSLDADTFASRAREVAHAIPSAIYLELPGVGHAAPISKPNQVWPPVVEFIRRHHPA